MTDQPGRTVRKQYEVVPRNATLTDLLDWCFQHRVNPSQVVMTGGHMVFHRPETDAERIAREDFDRIRAERTEKWERETYERLRDKYEPLKRVPMRTITQAEEDADTAAWDGITVADLPPIGKYDNG